MRQYIDKVQALVSWFKKWTITHNPREENVEADVLANLGSSTELKGTDSSSVVNRYCEVYSTSLVWDWKNKFINYLIYDKLPEDSKVSQALRTKVAWYCLVEGQFYRRSFHGPLSWDLGPREDDYVMRKVYEGISSNYSEANSLVQKLVKDDFSWPRMEHATKSFV